MTRRFVFQFMLNAVIPFLISTAIAADPFYQGKTLRVVVASAAGGGSDIVARLMMRHLSRHIPGNPTIIIENMPGAGEVIGVNYVYNKAKPDGFTALFATGTPIAQLLELPGIEFDFLKMPIVGGSSESVAAFIRTDKTGVKAARDLPNAKGTIVVGGYSLTRIMAFSPKTPAARVTELRLAFQAMGKDPAFLGEWEKSQGSPPRLVSGDEAGNIAASILKAPKEAVNILKKFAIP